MSENLINFDIKQYQEYWEMMEELNKFTDINNENKTSYGSFYNNAYTNSQRIMTAVLEKEANPLYLQDIKDFNKILLNKAFGTTDEETDNVEKAQGYFLGQGIASLFYSQISRYFLNDWETFVKKIVNSIQNIKIDGNTLEKKRKKNTEENIQIEEIYLFLKKNIIEKINDSLQEQDDIFELDTVDRSSGQTNIKVNGSSSSILSVNGRFKEKKLETVAKIIYDQFSGFLKSKRPSNSSEAWQIASKFYSDKEDRIIQEMKKTLVAYNISILTKNLFLGFWGETWTGIFQSIALDARSEQVGANKNKQKSKDEKKFLKQTPTDVIIQTKDGCKYRIQSKQWADSSLLYGAGEKKKKIGERELAYFGNGGANFQYFYDEDTFKKVKYLIRYGYEDEDNEYKLEERPDMFAHLSLGSFNLDTFLEYANEDVKGNDFFSFRGKIVPSVYLVKEFFDLLQNEIKKNQKNNIKKLVDISAKRKNKQKNIVGDFFGEPEYFKVKIKGISVNMKNL